MNFKMSYPDTDRFRNMSVSRKSSNCSTGSISNIKTMRSKDGTGERVSLGKPS